MAFVCYLYRKEILTLEGELLLDTVLVLASTTTNTVVADVVYVILLILYLFI